MRQTNLDWACEKCGNTHPLLAPPYIEYPEDFFIVLRANGLKLICWHCWANQKDQSNATPT